MPIDARETTWNLSTIEDFRAHGGVITVGPLAGANLLLMTSTGAQSGRPNVAPLGYTRDGERYVVVGSNSGRSHDPDWASGSGQRPGLRAVTSGAACSTVTSQPSRSSPNTKLEPVASFRW